MKIGKYKMALSTTENRILMTRAREALQGNWGIGAGAGLLTVIISMIAQAIPKVGFILSLLITGPVSIGLYIFSFTIARRQKAKIEQIFEGFESAYLIKSVITYLYVLLFTILWTLLLIIPGIIAAYSYSMTFLIMAEDKSIEPLAAIAKSKEMMQGNKWKLACLHFRFIGWGLLCILTIGIGFFWLIPYITVSNVQFYNDLKENDVVSLEKRSF
jgi:uncharacterized membrane protein